VLGHTVDDVRHGRELIRLAAELHDHPDDKAGHEIVSQSGPLIRPAPADEGDMAF
jgi:hypothetical protein